MIITILALIFVFGLLVFVHELGHFLAAKIVGVEVKTFAFGFPPRLWSKVYRGTTYAINALPLGGYVSLRGEDESTLTEKELEKEKGNSSSLASKKPIQLLFIFVSGVVMNVILAVILLYICYLVGFQPIMPNMEKYSGIKDTRSVKITEVEKGAPAEKEGIKPGDTIVKIDSLTVSNSDDIITYIQSLKDNKTSVSVLIRRNSKESAYKLDTYISKINSGGKQVSVKRVGVTLKNEGYIRGDILSSFSAAVIQVFKSLAVTFVAIVDLFKNLILKFTVSKDVAGPVGIIVVTNYFASLGFIYLLQFAAVLSISLAVFNILPIPALDGGQIFLTLIEVIMGRKIDSKKKNVIQLVGFGALILLILIVTVKDLLSFDIIGLIKGIKL